MEVYLQEEFLFPLLRQAEPGLTAPILGMLREHAQIWVTLESAERELAAGTGPGRARCRQLAVQLLHHNLKGEKCSTREPTTRCPRQRLTGCGRFPIPGTFPWGGCACDPAPLRRTASDRADRSIAGW